MRKKAMSTENPKTAGLPLRTALLLALALPGALLVSGCNKPAEPPPGETATPAPAETPPPATDTPPPTDTAPAPATDPASTPPADPNAPPAAEPSTPPAPADSDSAPKSGN
jgi:hypothetical protein